MEDECHTEEEGWREGERKEERWWGWLLFLGWLEWQRDESEKALKSKGKAKTEFPRE